jgi:formylglycine-generating enzyme required for sulfatase activity
VRTGATVLALLLLLHGSACFRVGYVHSTDGASNRGEGVDGGSIDAAADIPSRDHGTDWHVVADTRKDATADWPSADDLTWDMPADAPPPTPDAGVDAPLLVDTFVQDVGVGVYDLYVTVPTGWFYMGSPTSEPCRNSNETLHKVTLTHGFEIKATEVTQGQFTALMGYNPSTFTSCGDHCPVESLTWYEAAAYCNQLSVSKSLPTCYACTGSAKQIVCDEQTAYSGTLIYTCPGYRLPTEAEWEYAYRAGTTTAFYNGPITSSTCSGYDPNADQIGWYDYNAGGQTHPGANKLPNAWGIYDMAGNVWEYTNDLWLDDLGASAVIDPIGAPSTGGKDKIVARGASYNWTLPYLRAAARASNPKQSRLAWLGLRCVRSN